MWCVVTRDHGEIVKTYSNPQSADWDCSVRNAWATRIAQLATDLVVQAKNATWTANTDDLTPGSDCVSVQYIDKAVKQLPAAPL